MENPPEATVGDNVPTEEYEEPLKQELRQLRDKLRSNTNSIEILEMQIERYKGNLLHEELVVKNADSAIGKQEAQHMIKQLTTRLDQLQKPLEELQKFEPVSNFLEHIQSNSWLHQTPTAEGDTSAISRHVHEFHTKIVRQVLEFTARALETGFDTTELHELQFTVNKQVAMYLENVHASLAVLQKMQKQLDSGASAKRTRMQASGATARKPSDSAKKQKTSSPENGSDNAADADEQTAVNTGQTSVNTAVLLKFLQGTPEGEVNEKLRGVLKITYHGQNQVWEVLDENWLQVLNDELKLAKTKEQWGKVLNIHFTRDQTSPGWGQVGCKFSLNPNPRKNKRGDKDPEQESLKRRKQNENTEGETSGSGTGGDGSEDGN
jgi:hypothetical protein